MNKIIKKVNEYGKLIIIKHAVFSIVASLIAIICSVNELPTKYTIIWTIMAIIGAVVGGNSVNKVVDMKINKQPINKINGLLTTELINKQEGIIFALIGFTILVLSSNMLNKLCLKLSPIAIILLIIQPYAKKFTYASHLLLGFVCGAVPIGAGIAISGKITIVAIVIGIISVIWVTASDIIYTIKDYDYNKINNIYSLSNRFGVKKAIKIAAYMHGISIFMIIAIGFVEMKLDILYKLWVIGLIFVLYNKYKNVLKG